MENNLNRPIVRQSLGIAAAVYMLGALCWSMPEGFPFKPSVESLYRPFFQWAGLWQGWDMFAPNPRDEDVFVSTEIYFADGTQKTSIVTKMSNFSYLERYQKERWRKFFNDNLRLDSNKAMWNAAAEWFAREASLENGHPVARVELVRHWRKSLLPKDRGNVLDDRRPYARFVFHDWKANP
jgi:hypothetical protein